MLPLRHHRAFSMVMLHQPHARSIQVRATTPTFVLGCVLESLSANETGLVQFMGTIDPKKETTKSHWVD